MNRKQLEQWVSRDVDGELPPRLKARLDSELSRDPGLARLREEWASLARGHRGQTAPAPPASIAQNVLREIRLRGQPPAAHPALWLRPAWVGAAVFALVLGIWAVRLNGPGPRTARAESTVESVETFAPGSSAMVYEDAGSGVTIVWMLLEQEDPNGGV